MARVLVFDDDNEFLDLMQMVLGEEGFTVSTYKRWDDALEIVRAEQPDVVILDLMFDRELRGFRLVDHLMLDPTTRRIPVIVCSASTESLKEHERALGALGIQTVSKPFDLEQLLQAIRSALRSRPD